MRARSVQKVVLATSARNVLKSAKRWALRNVLRKAQKSKMVVVAVKKLLSLLKRALWVGCPVFMYAISMSKLVLYITTSKDGFIATADGGVEWLEEFGKDGEDYGYHDFVKTIGSIAMGSKTSGYLVVQVLLRSALRQILLIHI